MNLMDISRNIKPRTILLFLLSLPSNIKTQNIPLPETQYMNSMINRSYEYQLSSIISLSQNQFSYDDLQLLFDTNLKYSQLYKPIYDRMLSEFSFDDIQVGSLMPIYSGKNILKNLFTYNLFMTEPRFFSYKDEQFTMVINWREKSTIEVLGNNHRSYFTDNIQFQGNFNNIFFYTDFTLFRLENNLFPRVHDDYKGEHIQDYTEQNWLIWDQTNISLRTKWKWLDIEFSKRPLIWGPGKTNSPIFSGYVQPFPYLLLSTTYKNWDFTYLHGSLLKGLEHSQGKKFAGHRIELNWSPNSVVSFTELVVYDRPYFEWGYSLPVNLLWSEEHNLGNKDNMLMAIDGIYHFSNQFRFYGTFLWDEMYWVKLFKQWWGNKYVLQSGFYWQPFDQVYMPDLNVEFTLARPWTYTHSYSAITFTSAGYDLGFPFGPNSQVLSIKSTIFPSPRIFINLEYYYIKKGSGLGSNANDNYAQRNKDLDDKTPMLLGDITYTSIEKLYLYYELSRVLKIEGVIEYNNLNNDFYFSTGIIFDW